MLTVPLAPPMVNSYYAVDSNTIFLSWSPPPIDQQNGIIRHYAISLTERETGYTLSYTAINTTTTLSRLHPYYHYQIEVSAITIGTGPSSIPVMVQLPEDGMAICIQISIMF